MEVSLKVNREIRAPKVRVIGKAGEQIGILSIHEALLMAENEGLDLVEIAPGSVPPVCKIINFGKFRYDQTKREKENKKAQHQVKVKEVKFKPNTDDHDLATKVAHAKDFLAKGNKVKATCTFRGREMAHPEIGERLMQRFCTSLEDVGVLEAPTKMFGRILIAVLAPGAKKKKETTTKPGQSTETPQ